ncbi:MAG: DinB family protein [Pirellulales bacterium]
MFERELTLNRLMRHYGKSLVADIDDADMAAQPFDGANHPAWILGHVIVTFDGISKMLGHAATAPDKWGALFGRASTPTADRSAYPSKAELLAALDAALDAATAAAAEATPEQVAGPHSVEILKRGLPTKGDLIAMLLTTHFAQHLGQLSAWRRAMGGQPLF